MHLLKAAVVLIVYALFLLCLAAVDAKRWACNETSVLGDNDD